MAGYIGGRVAISSPQQIETKHTLTATASQTSIPNIGYTVGAVHVYQNGVRLVDGTDYTATNGSTVTLETGATEGDQIVIVSHGSFETGDVVSKASGGTFAAAMNYPGGAVTGDVAFGDNNKILMGAGSDLQVYHTGSVSVISEQGTGDLNVQTNGANIALLGNGGSEYMANFASDGAAKLFFNNAEKIATTNTGITVTGAIATSAGGVALTSLDIDGGTDIGAALVDADLMIVDDGAGGTNRKATMTRLATYMGTKIGGGMEFIASSGAVSDAASISFTQFDASKYDHYKFFFQYVKPATDNVTMYGHASTNGGTSYDTTNGNYHYAAANDAPGFPINNGDTAGNGTNEYGIAGQFSLNNPALATYTFATADGIANNDVTDGNIRSQYAQASSTSMYINTAVVNAIQFKFSSGNIASGEITMFGVVNS